MDKDIVLSFKSAEDIDKFAIDHIMGVMYQNSRLEEYLFEAQKKIEELKKYRPDSKIDDLVSSKRNEFYIYEKRGDGECFICPCCKKKYRTAAIPINIGPDCLTENTVVCFRNGFRGLVTTTDDNEFKKEIIVYNPKTRTFAEMVRDENDDFVESVVPFCWYDKNMRCIFSRKTICGKLNSICNSDPHEAGNILHSDSVDPRYDIIGYVRFPSILYALHALSSNEGDIKWMYVGNLICPQCDQIMDYYAEYLL